MTANKVRLEIQNYVTQAWTDVTSDVVGQIQITGVGLAASPGQTSPRGNQAPAVGKCKFALNNSAFNSQLTAGYYNPDINGLIWPRNKVRIRASGASLGYCLQAYVTGCPDAADFHQNVTAVSAINDVWLLTWDARITDSRYTTDFIDIGLDGEAGKQNIQYAYTNKWATYTLSHTCTGTDNLTVPRFRPRSAPGTNASTIEYRNISLTKNGGANLLSNGNFASGALGAWTAGNIASPTGWKLGDATLSLLGRTTRLQSAVVASNITLNVVPDTWIKFAGVLDVPDPAMHKAGALTVDVTAVDNTIYAVQQSLNQPPQVNQTADQIMTLLFNQFTAGTLPGSVFDTGTQTFPFCFDGYTYGGAKGTKIWDAMRDTAMSEFGRTWFDFDGTLRFGNRNQLVNAITKTPKLILSDGQPWVGHAWAQGGMINNEVVVTVTPRAIATSQTLLATLTAAVPIPPTLTGAIGTPVTITFVDATGKTIGGSAVSPPVYTANSKADGSGVDYTTQTSLITLQSSQVLASQAIYTFVNNTNSMLYITTLTVGGLPVTVNNPIQRIVSDSASQARYGKTTFDRALPYSADPDFAFQLANYFLAQYKDPFVEVDSITTQHEARLNNTDIMSVELFDVVKVSDIQGGISNALHAVVSADITLEPGATDFIAEAKFTLEKLDAKTYWILGDPTYSVLGVSTRPYI